MKRFVMIVVPLLLSIGIARAADTDPAAAPADADRLPGRPATERPSRNLA